MKKVTGMLSYFSKTEKILWSSSVVLIILSFCLFDRGSGLTLSASLIGVTSIIINAKGNPVGQMLMIAFSLLYGYISFTFSYFGEIATYIGMTLPMSVFALISWLRHPYNGRKTEVKVKRISRKEVAIIFLLSIIVTAAFYFILKGFNTANILPSTISVATSFIAVCLTFRRSPYFSIAYALNDIVLIVLWTLASMENTKYISAVVCFTAFLINDIYGFISWKIMERRQCSE